MAALREQSLLAQGSNSPGHHKGEITNNTTYIYIRTVEGFTPQRLDVWCRPFFRQICRQDPTCPQAPSPSCGFAKFPETCHIATKKTTPAYSPTPVVAVNGALARLTFNTLDQKAQSEQPRIYAPFSSCRLTTDLQDNCRSEAIYTLNDTMPKQRSAHRT